MIVTLATAWLSTAPGVHCGGQFGATSVGAARCRAVAFHLSGASLWDARETGAAGSRRSKKLFEK